MGNCFGSKDSALDSSIPSSINHSSDPTRTSTPGSALHSNGGGGNLSATSSSAGQSLFSAALSDDASLAGELLPTPHLKTYSFTDLKNATRNFKSVLGVGGFGTVYRGWVDEKTLEPSRIDAAMVVAVKKLNSRSKQGFEEWQSEVNFLGRLSHPNLVKLLGYCWEDKELLLVYEFMPRGSLENHLFRRSSATQSLSWDLRLKIAIGAAKGLAFLHAPDIEIIYRDFKASNILLDVNYNAKMSDFGLAKLGPTGGNSHLTTRIMGTYGYAAPEYIATGHLYVKSDVYGFGVVLLEIMTGRRALDMTRESQGQNLVIWLGQILSQRHKLKSIMDPRIEGQCSARAATQLAQLALKCLEDKPRKRPSMKEVVELLQHIAGLEKPKESGRGSSRSSSLSSHPRREFLRTH